MKKLAILVAAGLFLLGGGVALSYTVLRASLGPLQIREPIVISEISRVWSHTVWPGEGLFAKYALTNAGPYVYDVNARLESDPPMPEFWRQHADVKIFVDADGPGPQAPKIYPPGAWFMVPPGVSYEVWLQVRISRSAPVVDLKEVYLVFER